MKEYFSLQFIMLNRKFSESGIYPLAGYIIITLGFIFLSELSLHKTEFAIYLLIIIALTLLIKISETKRTEFLMIVFGNKKSKMIRIIENLLISLPFALVMLSHKAFLESALLLVGSALIAGFSFRNNINYSIPTPFYKKPFEFTVGFRNTFYLLPFAYLLTFIGIQVGNLNLGIFSMLVIFLICMSYYIQPENEFYVWSHSTKPSTFLLKKIKTATLFSFFLVIPIPVALSIFYPQSIATILLFALISYSFLWTVILAKYSAYPREMNIAEGILIAISIYFPPLLIALIPFFYKKSINKLNFFLK